MTTFDPYDHFGFLTNRVARLIHKVLEPSLEQSGYHFPGSCIGVLADLWATDGVNQKDLGISLIKTKSSINKMLAALEEQGLIVKRDDPADGRSKLIFLTDKGKAMRGFIEEKGSRIDQMLEDTCTDEEIATTKKVLAKMYDELNKRAGLMDSIEDTSNK